MCVAAPEVQRKDVGPKSGNGDDDEDGERHDFGEGGDGIQSGRFLWLTLSWVAAVTVTPLLGYLLFKPKAGGAGEPYRGAFFQGYRRALVMALRFRWAVLVSVLLLFVAAVYGFGKVPQNFFPPLHGVQISQ